ncbi:MAG: MarR family winged helix-turn-helix transcriptional regulator [Aestuariivirgaceae bacterium]
MIHVHAMTSPAAPSEQAIDSWAQFVRVSQQLLTSVEADLKAARQPPLAWYDALLELRRAGDEGLRQFQLQESMLLAQYNLSRMIDRLVRAGLVSRLACATDGRGHILHITPLGQQTLAGMWQVYRQSISRHFAEKLSGSELRSLSTLMGNLKA